MITDPDQKLNNFTAVITADALEKANCIYAGIEQESEAYMATAENEVLNDMYRYIKNETAKIRAAAGIRVSRNAMDNKRKLYARRNEMTDIVFEALIKKLNLFMESPKYIEKLIASIKLALDTFSADIVVFLRPDDMRLVPELEKIETPYNVEFRKGNFFTIGGLQVNCVGKDLRMDASYDSALAQLRENFEENFEIG